MLAAKVAGELAVKIMKNLLRGIIIIYFVVATFGAASSYVHFKNYGPYELAEAEVVSFSMKCNHQKRLSWNILVKINGVVSEHTSTKIGNYPIPTCFFGYAYLIPPHLNNIKENERIKVLQDINGRVYLGANSLIFHISQVAASLLLLLMSIFGLKKKK